MINDKKAASSDNSNFIPESDAKKVNLDRLELEEEEKVAPACY